jgi:hypothetical protein
VRFAAVGQISCLSQSQSQLQFLFLVHNHVFTSDWLLWKERLCTPAECNECQLVRVENCRRAEASLQERDEMVKYVEQEVDRVKGLFSQKERRLTVERDAGLEAAAVARRELDRTLEELAGVRQVATAAEGRQASAEAGAAAAVREAERLAAVAEGAVRRASSVEGEMRLLLAAFQEEKAASSAKAAQLQAVLKQWGTG